MLIIATTNDSNEKIRNRRLVLQPPPPTPRPGFLASLLLLLSAIFGSAHEAKRERERVGVLMSCDLGGTERTAAVGLEDSYCRSLLI